MHHFRIRKRETHSKFISCFSIPSPRKSHFQEFKLLDGPITLVACWELIEPHFGQLDRRFELWFVCYRSRLGDFLFFYFSIIAYDCLFLGGFLDSCGFCFSHYRGFPHKDLVSLSLIITCFTIVWLLIFIVFYWWF